MHFIVQRFATFAVYPAETMLGFDVAEYAKLCLRLSRRAERAFAHRGAAEFPGPDGRARQRAYFDAFRDLVAPCFGNDLSSVFRLRVATHRPRSKRLRQPWLVSTGSRPDGEQIV